MHRWHVCLSFKQLSFEREEGDWNIMYVLKAEDVRGQELSSKALAGLGSNVMRTATGGSSAAGQ